MRKNILAVAILTLVVFAGCSLFDNNDNSNDFYPLAKGNYWNLKMINQTIAGDSVVKDTIIHMRSEVIDEVTLNNGKKAYEMKTGATDSLYNFAIMGNNIFYIEKGDSAYFEYDSLGQSVGSYMAPITIEVGDSWDTDSSHVAVVEIDSVTVNAGTFESYKLANVYNGDTSWQWIAKGVGLVKMVNETPIDSMTKVRSTIELFEYSVK